MSQNVLTIETSYSDSDFKIEWDKVQEVYSNQLYTIYFKDKTLLASARLKTTKPGWVWVEDIYSIRETEMAEVVYFRQVKKSFWSKLSASLDLGYSLTKASNLQQYNASITLGYKTGQWTYSSSYRQVRSSQDDVDPIRRVEGAAQAEYSLRNGVLFGARINFLSNSEQNLALRSTAMLGTGYYLARTNSLYWTVIGGLAYNNEDFEENLEGTTESADRTSLEAALSTELNLYDIGDLDLLTNIYWYPSLTEAGRQRVDYKLDLSYDLPLDFYIKTGLTINYDSQPAPGASDIDYVVVTGFGWELD